MAMSSGPTGRGRNRRAPMAEINVTPLVDVMLVLLIIIMVTAPLLVAGVPVNLPDSRAKGLDQGDKPVQISLDTQGAIFIDDRETGAAELPARLAALAATGDGEKGPQIYLRADKGLDYGKVMRVMGELNRAGLIRVALVTTSGNETTK
jgi:biopolymer transport protein TolR